MAGYDVVVVGSGFGGSVAALRLTEKGYRVAVVEAGRRFADDEFAKTSWDLRRYLWAPKLGCFGIQRIHLLKDVLVLAGAGVGGRFPGLREHPLPPLEPFYADRQWAHITDWAAELAPYYDQASRMLGVVTNPQSPRPTKSCRKWPRTSGSPTPTGPPRSACSSASRADAPPIRTSAAPARNAPAARNAARA